MPTPVFANPGALADLQAVLEFRLHHMLTRPTDLLPDLEGPLALHAEYTRDEALIGLGHWDHARRPDFREGVLHMANRKVDAFFVKFHKTDEAYSPMTMYEDYAVIDRLFQWQSQSTTSADSPTGLRYIRNREQGYAPLLFVRERWFLLGGLASTMPFYDQPNRSRIKADAQLASFGV